MSTRCVSAGSLFMYMSASAPDAPPFRVTITGAFISLFFWIAACIIRAIWSEAPPAPAATTISTGFVGSQASACVVPKAKAVTAAAMAAKVLRVISLSLEVQTVLAPACPRSKSQDERRRVEALPVLLLDVAVELVDERRDRQAGSVALGFLEADAEVLAHPVHGESEVELARVHRLATVFHLPRLCRAFRDDVEYLLDVEAGALREGDPLGQRLHEAGDADLVHHLRELPGAGGPQKRHGPAIGIHERLRALEGCGFPAAHDGELGVLRAR